MIPIECPKCGREGNVPPDRLNAKLTCRGCQAVFHLDNSGRMVMGAPGDPNKDRQRPHVQYSRPGEPFNLGESLANIPKGVKFGVPGALLAVAVWFLIPTNGSTSYESSSQATLRSLLSNDKAGVVSSATTSSADAAGQWFDLMHAELEKRGIPADSSVNAALFSGNPDAGGDLVMMSVMSSRDTTKPPLPINVHLTKDGGSWKLNGTQMLADAQAMASAAAKKK